MTNCPDGPKAGHALTFQLDQLVGAGHLATKITERAQVNDMQVGAERERNPSPHMLSF